MLETDDLQLLYFDPFQTYLTPLVARTFYNSLQFQRRVFEWTPYEKSTVLLTDFADYGNAGAGASPRNGVTLFIAPTSHTLETHAGQRAHVLDDEPRSRARRQHGRRQAHATCAGGDCSAASRGRPRNTRSRSSTTTSRCRA